MRVDPLDGLAQQPPDLDWLRTFVVFAEHLNFTRAAEALHMSQPAAHGQVRKLADQLGVPLYRKVGRRLELTDEGEATRIFAREVLERSARFTAGLKGMAHGPVVLAAGEGSLLYLLGDAVRAFVARPGLRLRLRVGDAIETLDAVRTHRAHVGVAPVTELPADVESRVVARVGQQVVMPAGHPLVGRARLTVGDLAHAALIVPPPDRAHRISLAAAFDAADVPWRVAVEVAGWPLTLRCVAMGLGCAVVNDYCAPPPGTVARPLDGMAPRTWYALRRRSGGRNAPEDALWAALPSVS